LNRNVELDVVAVGERRLAPKAPLMGAL
jgi:hypothetical protein